MGHRLLLSGGGHRATLGAAGAICALVRLGRWADIDEVVSVSGGSTTNAALLSFGGDDDQRTVAATRTLIERVAADGVHPLRTPRRRVLVAAAALLATALVVAILAVLGLLGSWDALARPLPALLVGLAAVPAATLAGRGLAARYLADYLRAVTGGDAHTLEDFGDRRRRHVFCCAGLSSGTPYYLWAGHAADHDPQWGVRVQAGYRVSDAAMASSSLPGIATVRAPTADGPGSDLLPGGEYLVDGGVAGIFGDQIGEIAVARRPIDTTRGDDGVPTIVIDAGRHLRSPGRLGGRLQQASMLATTARWLKVSLEATYVNDLADVGDHTLVRLCEVPLAAPPLSSRRRRRPAAGAATVWRDGGATLPDAGRSPALDARLARLRHEVAGLGLLGLDPRRLAQAVTAGFVLTLVALDDTTDLDAALAWADEALGLDLSGAWAATLSPS